MDQPSLIPIEQLHESPFNPRKVYNQAKLQELADSIKVDGVLQPILVRPKPGLRPLLEGNDTFSDFELVFGHRRFRAAQLAGLQAMPCHVRAMDDHEVKRAQLVENLQRDDVHPIEEAEGFKQLMDEHLLSADMLCEQTGKSRSYVYGRLKLLQACKPVREACLAGEIGSEVALLIARLRTDKLQQKALGYIKGKHLDMGDGGKKSFRSIRSLLNERFTLALKGAIFDIDDGTLVPDTGTCTACTKRTGNAPEFQDVAAPESGKNGYYHDHLRNRGADVCTDPDCFELKKRAHLKREAQKLVDAGKTVVDGNKARAAIDAYGKLKEGFVPLADVRAELKKAKDKQIQTLHIQDPRSGKVVQAVKEADLVAAGVRKAAKAQHGKGRHGGASQEAYAAERERREAEAEATSARNVEMLKRVRTALVNFPPSEQEFRLIAKSLVELMEGSDDGGALHDLWPGPDEGERNLHEVAEQAPLDEVLALCRDCLLVQGVTQTCWRDADPENLHALAAHYGIDLEADEGAPTPSEAARATQGAQEVPEANPSAAPAPAKAAKKSKAKAKPAKAEKAPPAAAGEEQTDDAGVNAGEPATADAQ